MAKGRIVGKQPHHESDDSVAFGKVFVPLEYAIVFEVL